VEYQTTLAELQEKEAFARTQACEVLLSFHSVVLILIGYCKIIRDESHLSLRRHVGSWRHT